MRCQPPVDLAADHQMAFFDPQQFHRLHPVQAAAVLGHRGLASAPDGFGVAGLGIDFKGAFAAVAGSQNDNRHSGNHGWDRRHVARWLGANQRGQHRLGAWPGYRDSRVMFLHIDC